VWTEEGRYDTGKGREMKRAPPTLSVRGDKGKTKDQRKRVSLVQARAHCVTVPYGPETLKRLSPA
jgi:hypothetical protein